jgi:RNA polymerase primary sigma factor
LRHGLKQVEAGRSGLAQGNLRLVIAVARRYAHMGLPLGDLIQEGNLGLLHAIDKYDYRRGFKFSTYATWWIRQAVNRGLADKGRTIRIPVHVSEQRNKLLKAQRVATQDLERLPSRDELAERSGLPVKKIKQIQEDLPATTSLSTPVGDDESTTLIDLMADQGSPTALDETFEEQRRVLAGELLNSLPDRERTVLQMRFGIGLKQPYSLRQIAGQLRMSQESARQLEIEGLRKLRESSALTVDSDSL